MLHDNFIKTAKQESHEFKALLNILSSLNLHTKEGRKLLCVLNNIITLTEKWNIVMMSKCL